MAFFQISVIFFLLAACSNADKCVVEKGGLVSFSGKCTSAKARVIFDGEILLMDFKNSSSPNRTAIRPTFNFGGCKIASTLISDGKDVKIIFDSDPNNSTLYFSISAEFSSNGFKARGSHDKHYVFIKECVPEFAYDNDFKVIDIEIELKEGAEYFRIDFNNGNLYRGRTPKEKWVLAIEIILAIISPLLMCLSIGGAIYCYHERQGKFMSIPIASRRQLEHPAIQIDPPKPESIEKTPASKENKSPPAIKKTVRKIGSRTKAMSEDQTPRRSPTRASFFYRPNSV